jgi:peptidoglycan/LPS O-acetylase OafA/YrhL
MAEDRIASPLPADEPAPATEQAWSYAPQLDGLRAISILLVLYAHFWNPGSNLGHLGVRMFFVISGLLITAILIRARDSLNGGSPFHAFRVFYARRALRIFPAYYCMLFLALAGGIGGIRDDWPWHFAYLSNVRIAMTNSWGWPTSHAWTLSVEEQFYLVWPLVVLLARKSILPHVVIAGIVGAILFRLFYYLHPPFGLAGWVLTPASVDALGAGALLAIAGSRPTGGARRRLGLRLIVAAAVLWIAVRPIFNPGLGFNYLIEETLLLVPLAALVAGTAGGFDGLLGTLLQSALLRYIGRLSYGLYVYHTLARSAVNLAAKKLHVVPEHGPLLFVIATTLTFFAAALSWHLLEQPMNRLKRYLPYARIAPRGAPAAMPG